MFALSRILWYKENTRLQPNVSERGFRHIGEFARTSGISCDTRQIRKQALTALRRSLGPDITFILKEKIMAEWVDKKRKCC